MADDLDDLLDEVESKFCCSASKSKQTAYRLKQSEQRNQGRKVSDHDDIDAMLEEILDDDSHPMMSHESIAAKSFTSDPCSQTEPKKCCPVFLGGSAVPPGIGTSVSQRACNQLRCITCDFRVVMFEDHEWDPSCDYLFFRNNMPDCHKLRAKLRRRKGGRAYACQCSWQTAHTLSDLRSQHKLKWVCGKHKA